MGTTGPPALSPEGSGTVVGVKVANLFHWFVSRAKTQTVRDRWSSIIAPCPSAIVWGGGTEQPGHLRRAGLAPPK